MIRIIAPLVLVFTGCITPGKATQPTEPTGRIEPAASADVSEAVRAVRPQFAVVVPEGWSESTHPKVAEMVGPNGLALTKAPTDTSPGLFKPSIVITFAGGPEARLTDESGCAQAAEELAKMVKGAVESAGFVQVKAVGPSCQANIRAEDANRRARFTAVGSPQETFVITCNFDARDGTARTACDEVVQSFEFLASAN